VGRAVVGGAAGTGVPVRGLAVRVRVDLEGGTVASAAVAGVMGRAVAGAMGRAVAVAVGGKSRDSAGLPSGSSPS
jgi:hypothetical protein